MQFVDKGTTFICNPQIFISKHQFLNYISLKYFLKPFLKQDTLFSIEKKTTAKKKSIFPLYTPNKRAILIEALPFLNTMYLLFDVFLSLTQWSIIQLTQNILVSRTDDAATLEVEFFDAMGSPTHDTRHSKIGV